MNSSAREGRAVAYQPLGQKTAIREMIAGN